jgi:tetratricopeptide (TPR) repeat protein
LLAEPDMDVGTLFKPGNDALFYAKSWALVRLLTLDERYRPEVGRFLALVAGGEAHAIGFQKAFGKTIEQVSADVRRSLGSARPWVLTLATAPPALEQAGAVPQTPFAADLAVAALLENLQRFDEAKRILASLAEENSRNPDVESQLGDICMREAKRDEAFEHYSLAIEFGARDARVYFERAMIRRDDAAARGQSIADLREAVRLDPEYAEAYRQLDALLLRGQPSSPHKSSTEWTNRTGDRAVEGRLVEMDCSTVPARMVVETPGGELALTVGDPAKVLIGNDAGVSAELNCGRMSPRPVRVEYVGESGQITAIQFK